MFSFASTCNLPLRILIRNHSAQSNKTTVTFRRAARMASDQNQIYSATFVIKGRVQGVYYRATAATVAQRLGLKGYVKNLKDGSVKLSAQGSSDRIHEMKEWCAQGPPMASVTDVEEVSPLTTIPSTTYTNFAIRR